MMLEIVQITPRLLSTFRNYRILLDAYFSDTLGYFSDTLGYFSDTLGYFSDTSGYLTTARLLSAFS